MKFNRRPWYDPGYPTVDMRGQTSRPSDISGFFGDTASAISQHGPTGLAEPARGVSHNLSQRGSRIGFAGKSTYDIGREALICLDSRRYDRIMPSMTDRDTEFDLITHDSLITTQPRRLNPRSGPDWSHSGIGDCR